MSFRVFIAFCATFICIVYSVIPWNLTFDLPSISLGTMNTAKINQPTHVLFVGDVMLGRRVETYMQTFGEQYPFASIKPLLQDADLTVGNFEGTVPVDHVQTPELTFRFSVRQNYLKVLKDAGFDLFSLANNHAYDYGFTSYRNTIDECTKVALYCVGNPYTIDATSTHIQAIGDTRFGFLFLHTLFNKPSIEDMTPVIKELSSKSDVKIAYVHWGIEYDLVHSQEQSNLAHYLIDNGFDVVIGHHPHVVQDIELYKGKPIFYSLGNFIFDQFFSTHVEEGIGVVMSFDEEEIVYTVIPFSSTTMRSQPKVESFASSSELFARIFPISTSSVTSLVDMREIHVPR